MAIYSSLALVPILVLHGVTLFLAGLDVVSWSEGMLRSATGLLALLLFTIAFAQLTRNWSLFIAGFLLSTVFPYGSLFRFPLEGPLHKYLWFLFSAVFPSRELFGMSPGQHVHKYLLLLLGAALFLTIVCHRRKLAIRPILYLAGPMALIGLLINPVDWAIEAHRSTQGELELRPLENRASTWAHFCGALVVPLSSPEEYAEARHVSFNLQTTESATAIYEDEVSWSSMSLPKQAATEMGEAEKSGWAQTLEHHTPNSSVRWGQAEAHLHAEASLRVQGALGRYFRKEMGAFVLEGKDQLPERARSSRLQKILYDGRDLFLEIRSVRPTRYGNRRLQPASRPPRWQIVLQHPEKLLLVESRELSDWESRPLSLLAPFSGFEVDTFIATFELAEGWPTFEEKPSTLRVSRLFPHAGLQNFSVQNDSYEVSDWICGFEGP